MITFDDGYEGNYKYAYPVLKELGMKAVINVVVSETKGEPNYHYWDPTHLTWEEMKEMSDSGVIDIESHTYDLHYYASNGKRDIPAASGQIIVDGKLESFNSYTTRVKYDFKKSKDIIEDKIGKRVRVLSYPYGVSNSTTKKLARDVGYEAMFTIKEGVMRQGDDIMAGKRVKVKGTDTGFDIVRNIYKAAGVKENVPFYDLEKHWARADIMEMMSRGYIKGYPDKTFKPDNPVTRAEMVTMVSSVFGLKPDGNALPFNDVMKNAWYYVPVSSCYANGIIDFYGNSFGPDVKATREEVVSVLSPFIKSKGSADLSIYKDADEISPFAAHAMGEAVAAGIIKGKGDGYLSPEDDVTRAEIAVMIERILNQ
ncbi:MAG: S-layer homology domain-containing protein, partial [Thermoanaerobacteraceae bacterium]|nr:S-layer homology domain-containing protein [Thermoanaerobacteraceae bacterium]